MANIHPPHAAMYPAYPPMSQGAPPPTAYSHLLHAQQAAAAAGAVAPPGAAGPPPPHPHTHSHTHGMGAPQPYMSPYPYSYPPPPPHSHYPPPPSMLPAAMHPSPLAADPTSSSAPTASSNSYSQEILNEILRYGDSSWYANVVDYGKLRGVIKRIVFLESNPTETITFAEQQLHTTSPPSTAASTTFASLSFSTARLEENGKRPDAPATTASSQKMREIFWHLLNAEILKVEGYYLRAEAELSLQLRQNLQLDIRLFETSEAKERIKREHDSYTGIVLQQWQAKKAANAANPTGTSPPGSSFSSFSNSPASGPVTGNGAGGNHNMFAREQPPAIGSVEFQQFLLTLFPSISLSPQASLMFLQVVKEIHPSLWSNIALHAKILLPDLLSAIPYIPDATILDHIRHFLQLLLQLERVQRFALLNVTIILKLLKSYDSHTKRETEAKFFKNLTEQPLFTSNTLTSLVEYARDLIHTKLLPIKSSPVVRVQSILDDKLCIVCTRPLHAGVTLRCEHRMCLSCLVFKSNYELSCPVVNCPSAQAKKVKQESAAGASNSSALTLGEIQVDSVLSRLFAISAAATEFAGKQPSPPSGPITQQQTAQQQQLQQQQQHYQQVHHQQQLYHQMLPISPPMSHIHSPGMAALGSQGPSPTHSSIQSSLINHSPMHSHLSPMSGAIGQLPTSYSPMSSALGLNMGLQTNLTPNISPMRTPINQPHMGMRQPPPPASVFPVPVYPTSALSYPPPAAHQCAPCATPTTKKSCHQCKTMRDAKNLLMCTSEADGNRRRKCRKKFCTSCMVRLYAVHPDRMTVAERARFVCPPCLHCCVCAACRKKDEENGQPPVILNPKTGVPLISPYSNSTGYVPPDDGGDFVAASHAAASGDGLTMLASSGRLNPAAATAQSVATATTAPVVASVVSADPFSQFHDRDQMSDGESEVMDSSEVSAPVAALVGLSVPSPQQGAAGSKAHQHHQNHSHMDE